MIIRHHPALAAEAEQWAGEGDGAAVAALAEKAHRLTDPEAVVVAEVHDDTDPPAGLYLVDADGSGLLFRLEAGSWLVFDPEQAPALFQLTAADFAAVYEGV